MPKQRYFVSIIWGFPEYFHKFAKEEHYHIHALSVAKDMGYKPVVLIKNKYGVIEEDPLFDKNTLVIYYKNPLQYIFNIIRFSLKGSVFYVNSVEILSLIVPIFARKTIFMGHTQPKRQTRIKQIIFNLSMRLFSRMRLNNETEKQFMLKQGLKESKLFVVPLSISFEKYKVLKENSPRKDIVCFGNIIAKKNLATVVRAASLVAKSHPLTLNFVGKEYDPVDPEAFGPELKVVKHDFIDKAEDANKVLNNTIIYCNSSFDEGMNVAVYNAALAGNALCLPTIMSFTGVFKDKALFHDVTDYEELAKNIIYYLENPNTAREHNKLCRDMIYQNLSYEKISKEMRDLFTFPTNA